MKFRKSLSMGELMLLLLLVLALVFPKQKNSNNLETTALESEMVQLDSLPYEKEMDLEKEEFGP